MGREVRKTHSAETLKMANFFKDLSIQDSAYLNPCMPDYLIRDRGQDVIDKFCESVKKFGNKPNKHLAKIVLAGLDAGIYTMNNYNKLISCNLMPVLLCIAKSKHTPKPILLKISQNTNDEKLKDIININIAMQKHKLNTTQRKHIENLIEDVEKFGRSYIVKDTGNISEYNGPKPLNRIELGVYIDVINDIPETEFFTRKLKNDIIYTLNTYWDIKEKNYQFDINKNTSYHLYKIKENIIKNTNKNPNELWVYQNIDKINDIVKSIENELKLRNYDHNKGYNYQFNVETNTEER